MIVGTTYMVMETRRWNQIPSAGVTDSINYYVSARN